jgi:hypothetical protein
MCGLKRSLFAFGLTGRPVCLLCPDWLWKPGGTSVHGSHGHLDAVLPIQPGQYVLQGRYLPPLLRRRAVATEEPALQAKRFSIP